MLLRATVDVKEYALARATEISALTREIEQAKSGTTRRAFQTLPRHMRRRAASYNVKRLPIRLRLRALAEVTFPKKEKYSRSDLPNFFLSCAQLKNDPHKGPSNKNVRNCRRWRRRPANLSLQQQQSTNRRLPTHLWHAKRCSMIDCWGFRLPLSLNEKCLRSSMRSFRSGVLLTDYSYWQGFELDQAEADLLLQQQLGNVRTDGAVIRADFMNPAGLPSFPVILLAKRFLFCHPAAPVSELGKKLESGDGGGLFFLFGGGLNTFLASNQEIETFPGCTLFPSESGKECFLLTSEPRSLWYSLVNRKPVKVCGLQFLEHLSSELSVPLFPRDYPGAEAFTQHWQDRIAQLTSTWQKRPPAKRSKQPPSLPPGPFTQPHSIKIIGRGVLQERAQIIRNGQVIGFVTGALTSSLLHGCSCGMAVCVGGTGEGEVDVINPNGVHRRAHLK